MDSSLEKYLNLVVPQPLESDEYIRLLLLHAETGIPMQKFVQTFEEVEQIIDRYKYTYNIFISLSTLKKEPFLGEPTRLYRRQVIFLDFDQKDYPEFEGVNDYSKHLKTRLSWIYNHCIVASGSGGYHYYMGTETTENENLVKLNKEIAEYVGADIKAANSKQIVRIPTSYNLKNIEDKKFVKVVNNVWGTDKFKPYNITVLENRIKFEKHNNEIEIPKQEKPIIREEYEAKYYCVEQMINLGCKKGERNFALGRITAMLKREGYQYHAAKIKVLDWNKRCVPPKSVQEIESDFDRYWNNDEYRLLGCDLPEGRQKEILDKYCCKEKCLLQEKYEIKDDTKNILKINSKLLNKKNLQKMNGCHYLVLLMMIAFKNHMKKELLKGLLSKIWKEKTIKNVFKELLEYKIIDLKSNVYRIKDINSKYSKDIYVKMTVIEAFVKDEISKTDFVIYLALCVLLQTKNSATYDDISDYVKKDKSSISKYIKNLNKAKVIRVQKVFTEKGLECNRYTFI